jgi:hypothetical protein
MSSQYKIFAAIVAIFITLTSGSVYGRQQQQAAIDRIHAQEQQQFQTATN